MKKQISYLLESCKKFVIKLKRQIELGIRRNCRKGGQDSSRDKERNIYMRFKFENGNQDNT